jgi:hypothetical protein
VLNLGSTSPRSRRVTALNETMALSAIPRVKPGHDKMSYLLITVTRPTDVSPAIRLSLGSNTQ